MLEYVYKGFVVMQRGCQHRIPAMDRSLPNEAVVRKAIDTALQARAKQPQRTH